MSNKLHQPVTIAFHASRRISIFNVRESMIVIFACGKQTGMRYLKMFTTPARNRKMCSTCTRRLNNPRTHVYTLRPLIEKEITKFVNDVVDEWKIKFGNVDAPADWRRGYKHLQRSSGRKRRRRY